jgi:hypothetical protein
VVVVVLALGAQVKSKTLPVFTCSSDVVVCEVVVEPDCFKSSFMLLILK